MGPQWWLKTVIEQVCSKYVIVCFLLFFLFHKYGDVFFFFFMDVILLCYIMFYLYALSPTLDLCIPSAPVFFSDLAGHLTTYV